VWAVAAKAKNFAFRPVAEFVERSVGNSSTPSP
jgi:hypothetical protein